jgi:U3 small nucleolar RNA-associated protein 18
LGGASGRAGRAAAGRPPARSHRPPAIQPTRPRNHPTRPQSNPPAHAKVGEGGGGEGLLFVEDTQGEDPGPSLTTKTRKQRRQEAAAARAAAAAAAAAAGSGSGDDNDGEEDEEGAAGLGPGSAAAAAAAAAAAVGGAAPAARTPVWTDPADRDLKIDISAQPRLRKLRTDKGQTEVSGATYEAALRKQHGMIYGGASWAALPSAMNRQQRRRARREAAGGGGGGGGGSGGGGGGAGSSSDGGSSGNEEGGGDAEEDGDDSAERLLRGAGGLLAGRRGAAGAALPAGVIELSRLKDANLAAPSDAVVRSVEFHPDGQLLLTAGFDKKLRLFSVDGVRNPLAQSVHLSDCPIQKAAFAAGGGAVVAAGRRPFYYVVDLHAGKAERVVAPPGLLHAGGAAATGGPAVAAPPASSLSAPRRRRGGLQQGDGSGDIQQQQQQQQQQHARGPRSLESFAVLNREDNPLVAFLGDAGHVGLVTLRGRQSVGGFKLNGSARAAAFSDDGRQLATAGGDGVIYNWDLRMLRCVEAFRDEGSVGATALATVGSCSDGWMASGGTSGVVNVYRRGGGGGMGGGRAVLEAAGGGGFGGGLGGAAPWRTLGHLTTTVDTLTFSRDGQVRLFRIGPVSAPTDPPPHTINQEPTTASPEPTSSSNRQPPNRQPPKPANYRC